MNQNVCTRPLVTTFYEPITLNVKNTKVTDDYFWYRRTVSEVTEEACDLRVHEAVCRPGQKTTYVYFISNAGRSARLKVFVWYTGFRLAIVQSFEKAKSVLRMDHYDSRKFPGRGHHILKILTFLRAHFFLWHARIRLEDKAPTIMLPRLRLLISITLPINVRYLRSH